MNSKFAPRPPSDSGEFRIRRTANHTQLGLTAALATQLIWGVLPLWAGLFAHSSPAQMLVYRILFCMLTAAGLVFATKQGPLLIELIRAPARWLPYLGAALLLGANWLIFFMGVQAGRILEISFAYYLLPLLSIGMGVAVLSEKLTPWTAAGLTAAALGVGAMSLSASGAPWLALMMAGTFSLYTLIRKKNPIAPLVGLTFETLVMAPFALAFVFLVPGNGVFAADNLGHIAWLISFGPQTALSMALFNFATSRLRLSTTGMIQFISPSIALVIALLGGEHMSDAKLWGFGFIWLGVAFYVFDALKARAAHKAELAACIEASDVR